MINYTHSIPENRQLLAKLIRSTGDVILVSDAAKIFDLSNANTARRLARWTKQGWLRRVGRGAYVPATINSLDSKHVIEDHWVLVPALFSPAYIGGRTAAEYWDLTEQIFNDIVVFTAHPIRQRIQEIHGVNFTLKHIDESKIFGTKIVWRGKSKVMVSDLHRTIIDLLNEPIVGGGIHHIADCLTEYFKHQERNDNKLIEYADRLGNGAVFKRLGFLTEHRDDTKILNQACAIRLTQGNAYLDSTLESNRLVSKWKLWVPSLWKVS